MKLPPREAPSALLKIKDAYRLWLAVYKNFPRLERAGLGQRIEQAFLDVLELGYASSFSTIERKITILAQAIFRLNVLKFLLQLGWESKLIHTEPYAELLGGLEEAGRLFGGWKRGLQSKTPPM